MNDLKNSYTKDMIKSENLFLSHLEDFTKPQKQLKLKSCSSDYSFDNLFPLAIGENKGEKVPIELKERLERKIPKEIKNIDLSKVDEQTDVIVVGSGGAGLCAAIEAAENGSRVLILTKGKYGQSNTILAQGRNSSSYRAR